MVKRKPVTLCIDLIFAISCLKPPNEVFDNTLVQLVQDIGCDQEINVGVQKVGPEQRDDRLDPSLHAGLGESLQAFAQHADGIENIFKITKIACAVCVIADVCAVNRTLQTFTGLASSDKQLLGVVSNIHGKYGMPMEEDTITTCNLYTINAGRLEWGKDACHARVKEIGKSASVRGLVHDMK